MIRLGNTRNNTTIFLLTPNGEKVKSIISPTINENTYNHK